MLLCCLDHVWDCHKYIQETYLYMQTNIFQYQHQYYVQYMYIYTIKCTAFYSELFHILNHCNLDLEWIYQCWYLMTLHKIGHNIKVCVYMCVYLPTLLWNHYQFWLPRHLIFSWTVEHLCAIKVSCDHN